MKKTLLLTIAATILSNGIAKAETKTIYSVTVGETTSSATLINITEEGTSEGVTVSGGSFYCTPSAAVAKQNSKFYGIKIGADSCKIKCTPTGGIKAGDIIYVTAFVSGASADKSAVVTIAFDGGTAAILNGIDTSDGNEYSFADCKSGYHFSTESGMSTEHHTYEGEATASYFNLARCKGVSIVTSTDSDGNTTYTTSSSGTTVFINKIEVVREVGSTQISSLATNAEVVSTEYYTLSGAKVTEPGKGITIVKQLLSDGKVVTSKVIK